ncbi:MAG: hypothetical protein QXP04_02985, partial [Candidatus Nanoarchaeia archaeon]|nr:hypothetical protein [Candidatus Jingweiarchaeum tengchongense]
ISETGAIIPTKIREKLQPAWTKLKEKYPDTGFFLLFFESGQIKMAYLKLDKDSKEEFSRILLEYNLSLENAVPNHDIYKLKWSEEGSGGMEMKIVKEEKPSTIQDLQMIGKKIDKLLQENPNDEFLLKLKEALSKFDQSDRSNKIINDLLPRVVGVLEGYRLYLSNYQKGKAGKISLFKDRPDLDDFVLNTAKENNWILKFEGFPSNLNIDEANRVAGLLAGKYLAMEDFAKSFKEFLDEGIIKKVEEYYELKSKYDQLLKENKRLQVDINKLKKVSPNLAVALSEEQQNQKQEMNKIYGKLKGYEKELQEYKKKFEKIYQLVLSATDLETLKADVLKIIRSTTTSTITKQQSMSDIMKELDKSPYKLTILFNNIDNKAKQEFESKNIITNKNGEEYKVRLERDSNGSIQYVVLTRKP